MNILKLQAEAAKLPFDGNAPYYKHYEELHPPADLNAPAVTQEEADLRDNKDPAFFSEVLPAAFNDGNLSTGLWRSLGESHPIDPSYNHRESIKELTQGIPEEYHKEFNGLSREDDENILANIKNKMADQEVLRKTHGMSYLAAVGLAMFVDPPGVGMLGAEAKLLSNVVSKGSRAKNILLHGGSGLATMELYGAALAETQGSTLDGADALYLAVGGLAGGAIAGAFAKGASKSAVKMNTKIHAAAKNIQKGMDEELVQSVNVVHEPMSYAEALGRAGAELQGSAEPITKREYMHTPIDLSKSVEGTTVYHGTKADIPNISEADVIQYGNESSLYGPGLYLTDNYNIATGYAEARGGKTAASKVLTGKLGNVRLLDLEQPATRKVVQLFDDTLKEFEVTAEGSTTGDLYDQLAGVLKDNDLTKGDAAEVLQGLQVSLEDMGFDGFKHTGGLRTAKGKAEGKHNVTILFDTGHPDKSIKTRVSEATDTYVQPSTLPTRTEARAQEIMQQNAESIAKLKPPVKPVAELDAKDTSLGMFERARANIAASWDKVAKGDGSTSGMFIPFQGVDEAGVTRVATEGATPESVLAEFSKREGESASKEYFARAKSLEAKGAFKGLDESIIGQAQTKLGRFATSDSSAAYSFKAPEAKLFAFDHLENGTGVVLNPGSTAIKKEAIQSRLLSIAQPEFPIFKKAWREENGKLGIEDVLDGRWADDMNKELRIEMEMRTNAHAKGAVHESPHSNSTVKMADKLDDANAAALKERQLSGEHGAQEVVSRPGYVQLLWDGRLMREFDRIPELTNKFKQAYSGSVQEVTGIPKKVADQISKQVWLRAFVNDLGLDANPHALLSKDSREYFRAMLENSGELTTDEINGMLAQIDATMADAGASSRMKRRTGVDLLKSFEHEGKTYQLLDVVDNDMQRLHMRYVGEASGRAALGAKEILSEAHWTAQRSAILEGMGRAGDSAEAIAHMKDVIAGTYDQLLSRPVGKGVNRNARRVMDWTGASLLAQAGMPQIAEFSQIMGEHGVGQMWSILPTVKQFRKSLIDGSVDGGVIADIAPWTGRIWEEHILYPQNVRLAEHSGSDAPWLSRLDRLTASAKELSGYISGMYWIKSLQQQMTVALQSQKMAEYLKGIKFTDSGYTATGKFAGEEARLKAVGWDTDFFRSMKEVEQHFEWEGGTIQRLNMQKWNNPQLINTFVEGIHKHAGNVIQKPHVGNTAVWMHSTVGSMLTQFRTYPIVGLEKQTMRHLHMGDSIAMMTGMYSLGMSSLVSSAKAFMNSVGKPEEERRKYLNTRLSNAGLFKGALAYSSITSLAPDLLNLTAPFIPGMQNLVSTQATRAGGTRGINPSMKDIPSVGTVINAANAGSALVRNVLDPSYKYSKQDARAARSIIPLGTAHGSVQFLNAIEQGMVEP